MLTDSCIRIIRRLTLILQFSESSTIFDATQSHIGMCGFVLLFNVVWLYSIAARHLSKKQFGYLEWMLWLLLLQYHRPWYKQPTATAAAISDSAVWFSCGRKMIRCTTVHPLNKFRAGFNEALGSYGLWFRQHFSYEAAFCSSNKFNGNATETKTFPRFEFLCDRAYCYPTI